MDAEQVQPVDLEKQDWLDALDELLEIEGHERVVDILHDLQVSAHRQGVRLPFSANTPYINTIDLDSQPAYPGDREMERRIKSLIRWNAMAMVVRANREEDGIGGHISSYQSIATLYEVGFNHFFRGRTEDFPGDMVYFQGHSSPGIYARAFMDPCVGSGDGICSPRLRMPLSLSYDHRIIDGADGARFLQWIIDAMQEPLLLALEG